MDQMGKISYTYHSPVLAEYTPMYMVWVTFIVSGITQRYIPSSPPLLRCKRTTIWPLVLWKSQLSPELGTLVPLGKNQFPKTNPFPSEGWQQAVWLVMQSRALGPSPMSSRVTLLLFLYGIPLSTAAGKKEIPMLWCLCSMYKCLSQSR